MKNFCEKNDVKEWIFGPVIKELYQITVKKTIEKIKMTPIDILQTRRLKSSLIEIKLFSKKYQLIHSYVF